MCEAFNRQYGKLQKIDYRAAMPCNLYGPGDNFNINSSHVIPALIRKFYEASLNKKKSIKLWGSGNAMREFLYVDDLAEACVKYMNTSQNNLKKLNYDLCFINIGSQENISIKELALKIAKITNYKGKIIFFDSELEGVRSKLMDSKIIRKIGWKKKTKIDEGLKKTFSHYLQLK